MAPSTRTTGRQRKKTDEKTESSASVESAKPQGDPKPDVPFGAKLGRLYKMWVLDCVPVLAHAVSQDFIKRPELYKQIKSQDTIQGLIDIQSMYGYNPFYPSDEIRLMLIHPIFGNSDGQLGKVDDSSFQKSRLPVIKAAADYSENAQPTTFPMLRERIRSAIIPFRRFMEDLSGASLDVTGLRISKVFNTSTKILNDPNITARFSMNEDIPDDWPLKSTASQGAQLVKNITTQLNSPLGVISQDSFVRMQRIAQVGCESIEFILNKDIESINAVDNSMDELIRLLYTWGSDLGLMGGHS